MPKIYVIEDDEAIRGELLRLLEREGYETGACEDFSRASELALAAGPDLVLLDLTLPGTDGQLVCRELRGASSVPIIVLTSRTTEADEVVAMTLGADDFVPKPYSPRVLLARIAALLRRSGGSAARSVLEHNGVTLDLSRSLASSASGSVELTKNEVRILGLLMRRAGTIVSREDLMRELWDSEAFVDDNTLTVNVNRLRGALAKMGVEGFLVTHRGQGYSVQA
ncbi:response regulator transcription factor [uncultured Parolsenella sp.]|uniref:response regulator transcription factor n=1 Tax=uncultured Parolsenella sp. TaxID=2083008 RepID=UPI0027DD416D|nr:response regulator transcription factor [uncultured Parolsenella sp.]